MNTIPPATAEKLASTFQPGTRHKAAMDIAIPLIGNGLPASAVFATLREKFPSDVTDRELQDVVEWAVKLHPKPSGFSEKRQWRPVSVLSPTAKEMTPEEKADWWSHGEKTSPDEFSRQSPIAIPESNLECAILFVSSLYQESDRINVVCRHFMDGEKPRPFGPGKTLTRDGWIQYFHDSGVPTAEAGTWFRLNPCKETGTGKDGAVSDADVTAFRYLLLESDVLPLEKQLALFLRWKLPIAAVVLSGGHSAHAAVRIEAETAQKFKDLSDSLIESLAPFGIDRANKNPSRLSRFPGGLRRIGAEGDGRQRLLWLNPNSKALTEESLKAFQESLKFPHVTANPLKEMVESAIDRYEFMFQNQGKLGVPCGIPKLDNLCGGLKNGQTTVIAGATGSGKTTMATHVVLSALRAGVGVVLFSLEMDREEIFDLLVSSVCEIDRNKFNNGKFCQGDFDVLLKRLPTMSKMPLYIEDSPMTSVDEIRSRVFRLKADANIGLVVVDYIQFVNPGWSKDNREQQVAQISHGLRALAREVHLPMVVLSQLNDEGKLRESRVIAHNANTVMLVETNDDDFKISIVKARSIPMGEYHMKFDRIFNRLEPVSDMPDIRYPSKE